MRTGEVEMKRMDKIDGIPLERYELTSDDIDRALELGQELGICVVTISC